MKVLILDPDSRVKEYMTSLLRSEFSDLQGHFSTTSYQALEALRLQQYDLVLMENCFPDDELFSTLESIRETGTPVIVVGSDTSERLIVEVLQSGASDFVSKRNIKFGYLPSLIRRTLIRKRGDGVSRELMGEIRSHMKEDRDERRRFQLTRGLLGNGSKFIEGQAYHLIYLYVYFPFTALNRENRDDQEMGHLRRELMSVLTEIPVQYGGVIWSKKEEMAMFVFDSSAIMGAFLSSLDMRGAIRMFNITQENINGQFFLRAGMARSPAVYRENHGDIVSDGINLAAHMAFSAGQDERILVTEELFLDLIPRAKKYFFKEAPFERQVIYRYESTA